MKINQNKLKAKYVMGVWKSLPNYPTEEDFQYEIISYIIKEDKKSFDFSEQTIKSVFGVKWESEKIGILLKKMITSEVIIETEKSTESKKKYRFKKLPEYI